MNKKQTTILASIATVTIVSAVLFLHSLHTATASSDPAARDPLFTSLTGEALKIIVEVDSPYGHDDITSFKAFETDNLMAKQDYHILRLQGPIMKDKPAVLPWIADYLGKLPAGLAADGVAVKVGEIAKLTKSKNGTKFDNTIASTGKVTLKLLQGDTDVQQTDKVRQLDFSGCYIAGYDLYTKTDERRPYANPGIEHVEQITFACTTIKDLGTSGDRGILFGRSLAQPQQVNEKGELIIKSSEKYRFPIVIEDQSQLKLETKSKQVVKQEIVTRTELDKTSYKTGDTATFTVTFTDLEGNNIDPDTIRAYYDSQVVKLQKQDVGVYTFTTSGLTKTNHQLTVSAEKNGFATDTTYLTIPIQRIG